jgi:hypothetical protein
VSDGFAGVDAGFCRAHDAKKSPGRLGLGFLFFN